MQQIVSEFSFFQIRAMVSRSALVGSALLWLLATAATVLLTDLTPLDSLIAGLLVVLLHWFNELVHQYGHFIAARRVGYPFRSLRLWGILSTPIFPPKEGKLTPQIHIRRAIGGPIISAALTLVYLLLAWLYWQQGGMLQFLLGFLLLDNGVLMTIGALIPPIYLPFFANDGGTILHYWRQK